MDLSCPLRIRSWKSRDLGVSCQLPESLNFSVFEFLFGTMGIKVVPNHRVSAKTPETRGMNAPGVFYSLYGEGTELETVLEVLLKVRVG